MTSLWFDYIMTSLWFDGEATSTAAYLLVAVLKTEVSPFDVLLAELWVCVLHTTLVLAEFSGGRSSQGGTAIIAYNSLGLRNDTGHKTCSVPSTVLGTLQKGWRDT